MDRNRSRELGYQALERHEREQALSSPREDASRPSRRDLPLASGGEGLGGPATRGQLAPPRIAFPPALRQGE